MALRPPLRFARQYVLQAGFLDGAHGLLLCALAAAQVFIKYALLWDRTRATRGRAGAEPRHDDRGRHRRPRARTARRRAGAATTLRVAHLDTGRDWRGGQAQVLLLMQGLRARGVHNRLLAPEGPLLERARAAGIEVHAWPSHGDFDVAATLSAMRRLRHVDVAHAHSAHAHAIGVPAARLARVPAVVVSRRVDFNVAHHAFSRLKYRLPVDRYVCISHGVMDVMRPRRRARSKALAGAERCRHPTHAAAGRAPICDR